jgi:hypothetical protein
MPNTTEGVQPYQLFMFCRILPWTWFSSSLAESANSLIAGGNPIKKVLFPAEVLPIVSVLTNMVHFFLGLPILIAFLIAYQHYPRPDNLLWFPVAVIVQLVFTVALALLLSALSVLFRDIKDILANLLTLWFFATPIIYPWFQPSVQKFHVFFDINPFTHIAVTYQEALFFNQGARGALEVAARARRNLDRVRRLLCSIGFATRLREACDHATETWRREVIREITRIQQEVCVSPAGKAGRLSASSNARIPNEVASHVGRQGRPQPAALWRATRASSVSLCLCGRSSSCVLRVLRAFVVMSPEPPRDSSDRARARLEGLSPLRWSAVLDAEERAAAAQHRA